MSAALTLEAEMYPNMMVAALDEDDVEEYERTWWAQPQTAVLKKAGTSKVRVALCRRWQRQPTCTWTNCSCSSLMNVVKKLKPPMCLGPLKRVNSASLT